MSKIIATAAIRGAHKIVGQAEENLKKVLEKHGADKTVEFPNTGYFLPVTYGMTGIKVEKISDLQKVVDESKSLLPPMPDEKLWLPYLGHALDAGMATLFADEVIEVLKYLQDPVPYTMTVNANGSGLWLGAANDVIMRERGIEFVDGSAPGFAACVGAPEDPDVAVKIAQELQEKNLYVFMSCDTSGRSMAEQLQEKGVQLGWDTRLVPFGKDVTATVFALGFATRAAMAFGGVQPGDYERNLRYNKNRIFAFVLAFGDVTDEQYAQAAGAINYGFPVISDYDIPQILPTGICTYEHVVSQIPHDKMVQKAVEVRGLKIKVTKIPIPVAYGPAFEGERIRREDTEVEIRGDKKVAFEWLTTLEPEQVEDGKIEIIGDDDVGKLKIDSANTIVPYGMVVEVAGREMESDFEPIIERQLHHMINYASGAFHMGQRDQIRLRLSKQAVEKGLKLEHLGKIVHAKIHDEFGSIVDKVQVKIITDEKVAEEWREKARKVFHHRDDRIKGLTDEAVDTFYSCLLCQSFAPQHVCVVTPERPGLCGAVNWLDGKAGYQIDPSGGHQPIPKGNTVDEKVGQWDKANEFVKQASRGAVERMSAYSMIVDPMTSCFTADTEIIVDGQVMEIGDFVNSHFGSDHHGDHEVLTLAEGKTDKDKVVAIQKFKAPDELVELKTKSGVEFTATKGHEVAVDRKNGLQWIKAAELTTEDRLISLKKLDIKSREVDVIDLLPGDFRVLREEIAIFEKQLQRKFGSLNKACQALDINKIYSGTKTLSLVDFKEIVNALGLSWDGAKKKITKVGSGASFIKLVPLNKDLFYLLGLIASDGSITKRGRYEYWIDFINTEPALVEAFKEKYEGLFSKKVGLRTKTPTVSILKGRTINTKKDCYHIYLNNPLFGYLAESFGIKFGKLNWRLDKMLSLQENFIASFLSGLFDGDGSVRLRKYDGKYDVAEAYICIQGKKGVLHLQLLLKRLGIVGNIHKSNSVYKITVHGANCRKLASLMEVYHPRKKNEMQAIAKLKVEVDKTQSEVLPLTAGISLANTDYASELSSSTASYYRQGKSRAVISNLEKTGFKVLESDIFLDLVKEAELIKNNGRYDHVYNITLADNHTYLISGGPLVKNCGCFECVACILPMTNGIMIVDRDFADMTPCGMKFSTLAGTVGGGAQTPGFIGHSKLYIISNKFISADGGIKRIVWMPKQLKEELAADFSKRAEAEGAADLLDKIADEMVATTEEEVLNYITGKGHPALSMEPML